MDVQASVSDDKSVGGDPIDDVKGSAPPDEAFRRPYLLMVVPAPPEQVKVVTIENVPAAAV